MAYTTLNKMVTVFINNICSFINNIISLFDVDCRIYDKNVVKLQMFATTLNYLTQIDRKISDEYSEFRVKVLIFCYHANKGRF